MLKLRVTRTPCTPRPRAPQGQECMLFSGSMIASGAGSGVVTSIGMATEIGKIQSDIQVCVRATRWGVIATCGLC